MAFIVFFVPVLWAMIALLIPHAPNENFNLPNKGYWLAPQRRKQTLQYISAQFVWLSVGLTTFWGGLLHLTTLANLSPDKTLPATVWLLVLLVVLFIFAWAYRFGKPFYRVPGK
jgi:serine/threonine-protein kinase